MNYKEAKEATARLLSLTGKYTADDKALINEIHTLVFHEGVKQCNCTNIYSDAVTRLAIFFKRNTELNNCKYYMQAGSAFMLGPICYTNYNLTDEAAEELIATNPKAARVIHLLEPAEAPKQQKGEEQKEEQKTEVKKAPKKAKK